MRGNGVNLQINASDPPNYIKLWAYPGERPVFDFATMTAINKALDLRKDYWHIKRIEVKNCTTESGIFVGGFGAIIEGCVVHDCNNDGAILGSTSVKATNALILNCDSCRNFQASSGGNNGDGFAAKAGCSTGNVFRGCRAWENSDDGWDLFETDYSVVISNCWVWKGAFTGQGNGNGFKMGGDGAGGSSLGTHYAYNCVAFACKVNGFTQNSHRDGEVVINCLSFTNGSSGYNYFYEGTVNSGKKMCSRTTSASCAKPPAPATISARTTTRSS